MAAYYNEIDPFAAAWLRELIKAGHIAPGDVDARSIADVRPSDLAGYTQCHFFAGIGVWSYALRRAGWPDDRPVWTGSCPCPPFSAAGKGSECPSCGGKSCLSHPFVTAGWICLDCGDEWRGDDRHLLPEFIRLKGQCRPAIVFGEQVASRDGRLWLYTLRAVMEAAGYAVGAADLCAAGVGAPHIRQRLWFVEKRLERLDHTAGPRHVGAVEGPEGQAWHETRLRLLGSGSGTERLADSSSAGLAFGSIEIVGRGTVRDEGQAIAARVVLGGLAHAHGPKCPTLDIFSGGASQSGSRRVDALFDGGDSRRPGPTNGFWSTPDWLYCRDGKWRPVEPDTFPLAHGAPARVGRLRGYGNAICAEAAVAFILAATGDETRSEPVRLTGAFA